MQQHNFILDSISATGINILNFEINKLKEHQENLKPTDSNYNYALETLRALNIKLESNDGK